MHKLIVGQEYPLPVEIDADHDMRTVTFTANGEYPLSGGDSDVVRLSPVKGVT